MIGIIVGAVAGGVAGVLMDSQQLFQGIVLGALAGFAVAWLAGAFTALLVPKPVRLALSISMLFAILNWAVEHYFQYSLWEKVVKYFFK